MAPVPASRAALACLGVLAIGALVGCAAFRPLPEGSDFALAPDEGLLVVHTETDRPIVYVAVDGERVVRGLARGVRYEIVVAKAGSYRWSGFMLAERDDESRVLRSRVQTRRVNDYWRFRVEPGVLNYPGQLVVYTAGGLRKGIADARVVDRSALVYTTLRERHRELVDRFPLVYTGGTRDVFLERVVGRGDAAREGAGAP
ncbi:MAG: hypothetical protein KC560_04075 [Myxococcales bacterium]|nr:hypothetical protein [Myxococcales bacterium]